MKKGLTFLVVSLMLVFGLTACGGNDKQQETQNDSAVVGGDTANNSENGSDTGNDSNSGNGSNSGSQNSNGSGGGSGSGSSSGNSGSSSGGGSANSGSGSGSGSSNGGSSSGSGSGSQNNTVMDNTITGSTGGVTYEQMLRNGRVHDRDGDLTDHENSATPGTTF